jgi:Lon protease-like protein
VQTTNNAQTVYTLYEALPFEMQQQFLQELLQKQTDKLETLTLYLACKQAKEEDDFLNHDETNEFLNSLPS